MKQNKYFTDLKKMEELPVPQWEMITPVLAQKYLSQNASENRAKKMVHIDRYARDMRAGQWMITHQGIAFDKDGVLLDGQQRLNAVIKSGVPVPMLVIRGLDHNVIRVMDQGVSRTLNDAMKMDKEQCETLRQRSVTSAISALFKRDFGSNIILSQAEYRFVYEYFRKECDFLADLCKNKKIFTSGITAAILSALIAGEDPKLISDFCRGYEDNATNSNSLIPAQWKTQIILKIANKTPYSPKAIFLGTQQALVDMREGKRVDSNYRIYIPDDPLYSARERMKECIQTRNAVGV